MVDFFGDMESTFDAISKVANPFLDDEIQLSMMPYSMDFAKNAVKGVEPFYRKRKLIIQILFLQNIKSADSLCQRIFYGQNMLQYSQKISFI